MLWKWIITFWWLFPLSLQGGHLCEYFKNINSCIFRDTLDDGWGDGVILYTSVKRAKSVMSTYSESPRWALVFFSSVNTLCVLGFHWLHFWHFQIVPSTTFPAFTRITGPGSYRKTDFQSNWGVLCSCLDHLLVWGTFLPHLLHIQFTYSEKKLSGNIRDNFILWRPSFMHCMKQGSCRKSTK